jgi:hypothetical protein
MVHFNVHATQHAPQPTIDPAVRVLVASSKTPAEVLAENDAQEWDHITRVIAAVANILPRAVVVVKRQMVGRRDPKIGGTAKWVQYTGEIDTAVTVADSIDRLKTAMVTMARDISTEKKLSRQHAAFDAANCADQFE